MKYIVMLGDGMADYPVPELGGRTPLEAAVKPNMDFLAQNGAAGMVRTIPEGMPPGSDTANLSVMGYDPKRYYSGRSPLEAVSMGIDVGSDDVTFRCNLVTLSDEAEYAGTTILDYSAGEISTEEARELILFLNEHFKSEALNLYPGISYRHCLLLKHALTGTDCTPPHDISLKPVAGHLPKGRYGDMLFELMKRSRKLLKDHPVNLNRIKQGKNPANSCWFWGEGTKPALSPFKDRFGVSGSVIAAVDLIKGIGICAGLNSIDVEGATGNLHTNFTGKAKAALDALDNGSDFVYIHVEAPDECGHQGAAQDKVKAIELIDSEMLGLLLPEMRRRNEPFCMLLMPDHSTPVSIRTHTDEQVPFVLYRSDLKLGPSAQSYSEKAAAQTGVYIADGWNLMNKLINGRL